MVYVAVATDLFADGLLLGTGSAVSTQLGVALALGQVLADIPEGFSVIANFRDKSVRVIPRSSLVTNELPRALIVVRARKCEGHSRSW